MATEPAAPETPAPAEPAAKPAPKWLLPAVAVVAIAAGAGTGSLLIGPKLAPAPAAAADSAHAAGGAKEPEGEPKIFRVDNLIVNPAGSAGTRFLMVSVAFETASEEHDARLRELEVQVRDAVTSTLERQTLEMLTRPGARDSLKDELGAAVAPLLHGQGLVRVYLPQLVIQ